jgi:hypothetical protein
MIFTAAFLKPEEKLPYVKTAVRKCDAIKFFLLLLFESNSLEQQKYLALSEPLDEVGRMLGGWYGQLITKQNSPNKQLGEK